MVMYHRRHQNVIRTSVTYWAVSCLPLFCSYHILMISVIYYSTESTFSLITLKGDGQETTGIRSL